MCRDIFTKYNKFSLSILFHLLQHADVFPHSYCLSQRNDSSPSDGSAFKFTVKFVDKYVDCDSLIYTGLFPSTTRDRGKRIMDEGGNSCSIKNRRFAKLQQD